MGNFFGPTTCFNEHCFCESFLTGPILQPVNSLSGLSIVIVGSLIIFDSFRSKPSRLGILYGLLTTLIGVGTILYHATFTFASQFFEVMGIFLLVTLAVMYLAMKVYRLNFSVVLLVYLISNMLLIYGFIYFPEVRRLVFSLFTLLILILGYRAKDDPSLHIRNLLFAIVFIGLGSIAWMVDETRIWCVPESPLQGHALWHVLSALSVWFFYKYLSTDAESAPFEIEKVKV